MLLVLILSHGTAVATGTSRQFLRGYVFQLWPPAAAQCFDFMWWDDVDERAKRRQAEKSGKDVLGNYICIHLEAARVCSGRLAQKVVVNVVVSSIKTQL